MKIQFSLTNCEFSEKEILDRVEKDWGVRRPNRNTKSDFSFYDADNLKYAMAVITSPKEYAGKIVGYSGVGEYEDLLVDAGTFVVGGNFSERNNLPDFRGNQVGFRVRGVRDNYAESLSDSKNIPFLIVVIAGPNNYTRTLESKGYEVKSNGIPEWAKKRTGNKFYVVYNPIAKAMKKAWEILKLMPQVRPPMQRQKQRTHEPTPREMQRQFDISRQKGETCDYCHRPPVLDCGRCGQKLCKRHLSMPCTTGEGDYRYG